MDVLADLRSLPKLPDMAGTVPRWFGLAAGMSTQLIGTPEFAELVRVTGAATINADMSISGAQSILLAAAKACTGGDLLRVTIVHRPWRRTDGFFTPASTLGKTDPQSAMLTTTASALRNLASCIGYLPDARVFCDLEHWKGTDWGTQANVEAANQAMASTEADVRNAFGPQTAVDWYDCNARQLESSGRVDVGYLPTQRHRPGCPSLYCGDQLAERRSRYTMAAMGGETNCVYGCGHGPTLTTDGLVNPAWRDYDRAASWWFGRDLYNTGAWSAWAGSRDYSRLRAFYLWPAPRPIAALPSDSWWPHFVEIVRGANNLVA